jgi:hypothetical protein
MLATLCDGNDSTGNAKIAGRKDNSVRRRIQFLAAL